MKIILKHLLLLPLLTLSVQAKDYQIQTLETAHRLFRSATNTAMYAEAAAQYEYLVSEEGIRNGDLFYTLGNAWFMAGDLGRAILNYRRAEHYLPRHPDVRHNLKVAFELRTDLIPEKKQHPFTAKLLGWHFNTSVTFRWWGFSLSWLALWGAAYWLQRSAKKEALIAISAAGLLAIILFGSLLGETINNRHAVAGVITVGDVLARKGNGEMYAPAFLEPLHSGTEFRRLENRGVWWQIELDDGQTCWIPSHAGELLTLAAK